MVLFDLYRRGFELGHLHGRQGERRRASWELKMLSPVTWAPFVDVPSFLSGYKNGFDAGATTQKILDETVTPAVLRGRR